MPDLHRIAPREVTALLSEGSVATQRDVSLVVSTLDLFEAGQMKVWGDIDPRFRPEDFGAAEGDARWIPFTPSLDLVLSAVNGPKVLHLKVQSVSGASTNQIDIEVDLVCMPHPSVLWSERRVLTKGSTFSFGWSPSHDVDAWEVLIDPHLGAMPDVGRLLAFGSSVEAGEYVQVDLDVDDIEDEDPNPTQSGIKMISIFVLHGEQWWSGRTPWIPPESLWGEFLWGEGWWG